MAWFRLGTASTANATRSAQQKARASSPAAHRALHLALLLALADRLALVVRVLAAGQRDLDLRVLALEVDARRHDGQAALADAPDEAVDLTAVQQQLARPVRVVVRAGGGPVVRDVRVGRPPPPLWQRRVAVAHWRAAGARRLDPGAQQHDARLDVVEQLVAEPGLAVRGDVARC